MSTLLIRGREHRRPSWWHGAGWTAKAAWIAAKGVPYEEACAILRGSPKRRPVLTAQEVFAENERRGLA